MTVLKPSQNLTPDQIANILAGIIANIRFPNNTKATTFIEVNDKGHIVLKDALQPFNAPMLGMESVEEYSAATEIIDYFFGGVIPMEHVPQIPSQYDHNFMGYLMVGMGVKGFGGAGEKTEFRIYRGEGMDVVIDPAILDHEKMLSAFVDIDKDSHNISQEAKGGEVGFLRQIFDAIAAHRPAESLQMEKVNAAVAHVEGLIKTVGDSYARIMVSLPQIGSPDFKIGNWTCLGRTADEAMWQIRSTCKPLTDVIGRIAFDHAVNVAIRQNFDLQVAGGVLVSADLAGLDNDDFVLPKYASCFPRP